MFEGLVFVPKLISYISLLGLIIAGIAEFRQGHIGRLGIAANAFLLWQIFFSVWGALPIWVQWYLNVGTILAVIAIFSYLFKLSLIKEFYQVAFILYGSFSLIFAIIFYFLI